MGITAIDFSELVSFRYFTDDYAGNRNQTPWVIHRFDYAGLGRVRGKQGFTFGIENLDLEYRQTVYYFFDITVELL